MYNHKICLYKTYIKAPVNNSQRRFATLIGRNLKCKLYEANVDESLENRNDCINNVSLIIAKNRPSIFKIKHLGLRFQ